MRVLRKYCLTLAAIVALISLAGCSSIDKTKFDHAYHAGKVLETATAIGATYEQFGSYIQDFAVEVAITEEKATNDKEKELARMYHDVLAIYLDSHILWKMSMLGDKLQPEEKQMGAQILKKYSMQPGVVNLADLWNRAKMQLRRANQYYLTGQRPI
jgi:uncharacterized lipoprotein YehR (DUF1307 family)